MLKSFVSYEAVHGLGRQSRDEVYHVIESFLQTFTNNPKPRRRDLCLDLTGERERQPAPVMWTLISRFGPFPSIERLRTIHGKPQKFYRWHLRKRRFENAFPLVERLEQKDSALQSRLFPQATWNFLFADPETDLIFPDQRTLPSLDVRFGDSSFLQVSFKRTPLISVRFLFPFENADTRFRAYVKDLESSLPFRFRAIHWRLWNQSKHGVWYSRKLSVRLAA